MTAVSPQHTRNEVLTTEPPVLYLARHATPDRTTGIRYDIMPGPPLLDTGKAEAERLGHFLREQGVCTIFASPLERTRQTASIAGAAGGIPVVHDQELIAEAARESSEDEVRERMLTFWEEAVERSEESGPVAIISHGAPIRYLITALGFPIDTMQRYQKIFDYNNPSPPAGCWRATRREDGSWSIALVWMPEPVELPEAETVAA